MTPIHPSQRLDDTVHRTWVSATRAGRAALAAEVAALRQLIARLDQGGS